MCHPNVQRAEPGTHDVHGKSIDAYEDSLVGSRP